MKICVEKVIQELKKYFAKKEGIVATYLFGSYAGASPGAKPYPDVDIAILLDENHPYKDTLDAKIKFTAEIESLLCLPSAGYETRGKLNEGGMVDVIILNDAPIVFRHEVIKCNKLIYERDRNKRIEFEFNSELNYFDTIPLRRGLWESLVKRIKEGTFGGRE